jgi:hypothetical protein
MTLAIPQNVWSEKLIARAKASPAKSAMVCGLGIIFVAMWGRVLLGSHGPAAAQGSVAVISPATSSAPDATAPDHVGNSDISLQQWVRQPAGSLQRNPFVIPLDSYPRDDSKPGEDSPAGNSYWDLLRKSMSAQADQQEQRQILVDNIRIAAGALKLQSTLMGAQPTAMVNGQMVREGNYVSGFHVVKIEPREMIIEQQGVRLAVSMDD